MQGNQNVESMAIAQLCIIMRAFCFESLRFTNEVDSVSLNPLLLVQKLPSCDNAHLCEKTRLILQNGKIFNSKWNPDTCRHGAE